MPIAHLMTASPHFLALNFCASLTKKNGKILRLRKKIILLQSLSKKMQMRILRL